MMKRAIGFDAAAVALGPVIGVLVALAAGQETSWDFRNYHWYNAYALLTWRYDQDIAVAHHATYNNPVLDLPYYLAGNALPPVLTLALLAAVTGLNFSLLYLIARSVFAGFEPAASRLMALTTAAIGFFGGMSFPLIATTYYDNVVSLFVLGSLLELLKLRGGQRAPLMHGARRPSHRRRQRSQAHGDAFRHRHYGGRFGDAIGSPRQGGSSRRAGRGGSGELPRHCRPLDAASVACDGKSAVSLFQ
jgi:hypothetical protein